MSDIERLKFNIFLLGDTQVGKTSMIEALEGKPFRETNLSTIGVDFIFKSAVFDGKKYDFKIYDTAGQERYQSIGDANLKISDGFLLVFSVDKKNTLDRIDRWIENIEKNVDTKEKVLMLVGNKNDVEEREVSNEDGMKFAKEKKFKYFETSAKTKYGIKEVFDEMFNDIYQLSKKLENNGNQIEPNAKLDKKDLTKKKKRRC